MYKGFFESQFQITEEDARKIMNSLSTTKRSDLREKVLPQSCRSILLNSFQDAVDHADQSLINDCHDFKVQLSSKLNSLQNSVYLTNWLEVVSRTEKTKKLGVFLWLLLTDEFKNVPLSHLELGSSQVREALKEVQLQGWETSRRSFDEKLSYLRERGFKPFFPFSISTPQQKSELLAYEVSLRKVFTAILFYSLFPKSTKSLPEIINSQMSKCGGDLKKILLSNFESYVNKDGVFTRNMIFQDTVILEGSKLILNEEDWSHRKVKVSWRDPNGILTFKESRTCFNLNGFNDLFTPEPMKVTISKHRELDPQTGGRIFRIEGDSMILNMGIQSVPDGKVQEILSSKEKFLQQLLTVDDEVPEPTKKKPTTSSTDIFAACFKRGAELALIQESNKVVAEGLKEILKTVGLDLNNSWGDTLLQLLTPTLISYFSSNGRLQDISTGAYSTITKEKLHGLLEILKPTLVDIPTSPLLQEVIIEDKVYA